jgi:hypothetical protein
MAYLKTLDIPADDIVTVTIPAAEAARLRHGNAIYAVMLAKASAMARAQLPRRVMTGDYTSSSDDGGGHTASFALAAL